MISAKCRQPKPANLPAHEYAIPIRCNENLGQLTLAYRSVTGELCDPDNPDPTTSPEPEPPEPETESIPESPEPETESIPEQPPTQSPTEEPPDEEDVPSTPEEGEEPPTPESVEETNPTQGCKTFKLNVVVHVRLEGFLSL